MEITTIQCLPKERCTGCAACVNRCPTGCISMQSDEEGFLRPVIDENKCVKCGACKGTCPILNISKKSSTQRLPGCYAAWSKDDGIRFHSTSGGIFTHLAQAVLAQGGLVAGARYRADHLVEHTLISNEVDLEALRQSKYVQSETGLIYREIQIRLEQREPVLFAGTPCQCAGLLSFLGKGYDGLFLCDFICRGVNSPKVYLAYLNELESLYGSPIKRIWFKNKTYGWNHFCTKVIFEDGQEYLADRETDPFMLGYIKSKLSCYMRPSCYDCQFKGIDRSTDITLGDFWGASAQNSAFDPDAGTSLVLIHTSKGEQLLRAAKGSCVYEADLEGALKHNICAVQSVKTPPDRATFFEELNRRPFSHIILEKI